MSNKFRLLRVTLGSMFVGFLVFALLGILTFTFLVMADIHNAGIEKFLSILVVIGGISVLFWWFRRKWDQANTPPEKIGEEK